MDQVDRTILKLLQKDAKLDVKYIAEVLNMSKTPVYERIKRLERSGVIDKYVAVVNRKKVSSSMIVFCQVSLEDQKIEKINQFRTAIAKIPEVMECYLMGGANDFLLKLIVEDLDAYHRFSSGKLAALPNVSQIQSSFVLDEVKHSTVLPFI
ncbi:MAG: Lrp/AsnC family transcriptional regulator [Flavobacteriales bacterium]|nr:Lrp/AsnC family transcriptional regulator [Flavobacteriales bacterium]